MENNSNNNNNNSIIEVNNKQECNIKQESNRKQYDDIDQENSDSEWESIPENEQLTDETKTAFFRLNLDNASKIKNTINQMKHFHSNKIRLLSQKEKQSFLELQQYIKKQYLPNISIKNQKNETKLNNPYIKILNDEYLINTRKEIGTNLIYEIDDNNQDLKLLGTSDTWYETTILKPKKKEVIKKPKNKIIIKKKLGLKITKTNKKIHNKEKIYENKNNNVNNMGINGKFLRRKRKKRKIKYTKDSTVIEIRRIDNKNDEHMQVKKENNSYEKIGIKQEKIEEGLERKEYTEIPKKNDN